MRTFIRSISLAAAVCVAAAVTMAGCDKSPDETKPEPSEIETDFDSKQAFIQVQRDKIAQIEQALAKVDRAAIEDEDLTKRMQELDPMVAEARAAVSGADTATRDTWDRARTEAYAAVSKLENTYAELADDLPDEARAEARE